MGIAKHIIGSFGDIGGEVIKEAVNVPKDIAGTALESFGTPGGKKGNTKPVPPKKSTEDLKAFGSFDAASDKDKKIVARSALAALAKPQKKEPSDFEKRQTEEQQREKIDKEQKELQGKQALPKMSSKRRRGDLYGIQSKQGSERSKNIKAE